MGSTTNQGPPDVNRPGPLPDGWLAWARKQVPDPADLQAVAKLLVNGERLERLAAEVLLTRWPDQPAACDAVLRTCDGRRDCGENACRVVEQIGDSRAVPLLFGALDYGTLAAATALAAIGTPEAESALAAIVKRGYTLFLDPDDYEDTSFPRRFGMKERCEEEREIYDAAKEALSWLRAKHSGTSDGSNG